MVHWTQPEDFKDWTIEDVKQWYQRKIKTAGTPEEKLKIVTIGAECSRDIRIREAKAETLARAEIDPFIMELVDDPDSFAYHVKILALAKKWLVPDHWRTIKDSNMQYKDLDQLEQLGFIEGKIERIVKDGCPKGCKHFYRLLS